MNNFNRFEPAPETIAIFRALQLGDLLCSVPAFRAIRAAFPKTKITLVGLKWAQEFVNRFPLYFDEFVEFPGYPGLPEQAPQFHRIPAFFREMQKRQFDLALQMHGSGAVSNPVTLLFGAKMSCGFFPEDGFCPDPDSFIPYSPHESEIWLNLRLLQFLDIPIKGDELEYPLYPEDEKEFSSLEECRQLQNYVCIHPGSRMETRRWLPERFAEVGDAISALGFQVVLTGTQNELDLAGSIANRMKTKPLNLAGKTTLGSLGILLKKAGLLVCNDTGVSHIAAALKTPSAVIVTGSDPVRWSPLNRKLHRVSFQPVNCRPCFHDLCPIGYPCAKGVKSLDIIADAKALLAEAAGTESKLCVA